MVRAFEDATKLSKKALEDGENVKAFEDATKLSKKAFEDATNYLKKHSNATK